MAIPKLFTLARMTTATTSTGTITLGAAATVGGVLYLSFAAAGVADGDIIAYGIQDTSNSEYGYGTYTASGTTLTRNVIRSTNSNNAINLTGTAQVFICAGGSDLMWGYSGGARNFSLAASVAANALTIALKDEAGADPSALSPVLAPYRSATAATGTVTWQAVRAATSLVISSGSTLGAVNSIPFRVWVVLFDDGGTMRLGAINCVDSTANVFPLGDYLASSTAEGGAGAADSAGVIYTGTAVTTKAYRILGYLEWGSGLGTVGTWSAGPTIIQLYGAGSKAPGDVIQVQRSATGAVATGTTVLPADDTIPQITEGNEFITKAITPTSVANVLRIKSSMMLSNSAGNNYMMSALFQDATANALAMCASIPLSNNTPITVPLAYQMLAATTSSTTFRLRGGYPSAATVTFNGSAAARLWGGVIASFLEVEEVMG